MIRLQNISKSYRVKGQDVRALEDISCEIGAGEIFGVIGHSGAGKSTLIRLINLLERPQSGALWLDGREVTHLSRRELPILRRDIGMIFQHFNLLKSKTVADNVAFPLQLAGDLTRVEIKARIVELLQRVGLTQHAQKYPNQLSGGQKQRVGIARALASRPKVLLCDEATSALDPQTTQSVLRLLAEINQELGLTIVLITHEMDVIRRICDRVAVLDGGRIVENGKVNEVFLHPQHPTTRSFLQERADGDNAEDRWRDAKVFGPIFLLTFEGAQTYVPILGDIARKTGVDYSILAARVDRIKDVPFGQLTVSLVGGNTAAAVQKLQATGIHVEQLSGKTTQRAADRRIAAG